MPRQHDDDHIDNRHRHEPERVRSSEPIALIHDEQRERDHRNGVIPEPAPQQAGDDPELDQPVSEQIGRHEMPRPDGNVLRRVQQRVRDQVARILRQFPLRDGIRQADEIFPGQKPRRDAAKHLDQRKRSLQPKARHEDESAAWLRRKAR